MLNKQTMRVVDTYQDKIVAIGDAQSSYIDEDYFKKKMGENLEDERFKSYPVKVVALRMQWILQEEGEEFLLNILRSENLDIYAIPAIQIMIEYLYLQYKEVILKYNLPVYGGQLLCFFGMLYLHEHQYKTESVEETLGDGTTVAMLQLVQRESASVALTMLVTAANFAMTCYTLALTLI